MCLFVVLHLAWAIVLVYRILRSDFKAKGMIAILDQINQPGSLGELCDVTMYQYANPSFTVGVQSAKSTMFEPEKVKEEIFSGYSRRGSTEVKGVVFGAVNKIKPARLIVEENYSTS